MITLVQIEKLLRDIATAHPMINSYGSGDLWEYLAGSDPDLNVMWNVLKPANRNGNIITINGTLYFMDAVKGDESNEIEVLSDQFRTALDVITTLSHPDYFEYFKFSASNNMEDFTEKTPASLAGWAVDYSLEIFYDKNHCELPNTLPTI